MKTKVKKLKLSSAFAILFWFFAFSPQLTKAQCPSIANKMGCAVDVTVETYLIGFNPNAPCTITGGYSTIIPANTTIPVTCGGAMCNVKVTITAVGGNPVAPVSADFSTTSPQALTPCNIMSARASLVYSPSTNTFMMK